MMAFNQERSSLDATLREVATLHPAYRVFPSGSGLDLPGNSNLNDIERMKYPTLINGIGLIFAYALLSGTPSLIGATGSEVPAEATATVSGRVQNAVTGQFLSNARVSILNTDLSTFTDETGRYVISRVPTGQVTIEVFYTGLDTASRVLAIAPGQRTASANFELTNLSRYGEIVELNSFVVASSRQLDGAALATNTQRFAPNLVNVVATDQYGDVPGGNVGEMVKFIPGVTVTIGGSGEAAEISVRGLSTHLTNISMDGGQVAQANTISNTRGFELKGVNIAAVSSVEVTKLPLPSSRADSLSGSVNLVSKSAFDRSAPELRYRTYIAMNSEWMTLRRKPFPYETKVYKAQPGFDIAYTKPVNENLGFVITAAHNRAYNPQNINTMTWNGAGTNTGASPSNPFLQSYSFNAAPKVQVRQSFTTKVDWRVRPHAVLSLNFLASRFRDDNANFSWAFNAGTNGAPTPASGRPLIFTPDSTEGATGRGAVTFGGGHHHYTQRLHRENLRYLFDDGTWRILSTASYSNSTTKNNKIGRFGDFNNLARVLSQPARVTFTGVADSRRPVSVQAFNNANQEIDLHDLNSYVVNTAGSGSLRDIEDTVRSLDLGVRRALDVLPVPAYLEIGGAYRDQDRDDRRPSFALTYSPPDGNRSGAAFASQVYSTRSPIDPSRNVPWLSPKLAYQAWQDNPNLFVATPAQEVARYTSVVNTSQKFKESVIAGYLQASAKLLDSRLHVVSGVRYEETKTRGLGPLVDPAAVWVRNPDGSFARTSTGARIRKPEAGAVGSIEQARLTHIERGASGARSYDGFYPSVHLTYNITSNLLARLAYARTYGRPDFSQIVPNATVDEDDLDLQANPEAIPGRITINNPGLKPWTADNYDLSVEYYTDKGGLFTVGAFRKEITDFFGAVATLATAADIETYNLDPRFIGWTLRTTTNAGDARVSGLEFAIQHSLAFAGTWGRNFDVFVNGTKLRLEGENEADWRGFIPELLNWGVTYTRRPLMVRLNWSYQGENQLAPVATMGTSAFQFRQARLTMDANLEYFMRENMSLFINGRNIFNEPLLTYAYGPETPDYAKFRSTNYNGAAISFGVKGRF